MSMQSIILTENYILSPENWNNIVIPTKSNCIDDITDIN